MDEEQSHQILSATVAMATKGLTDGDLSQLYLMVELEMDPRQLAFYSSIESMFDENGKMHEEMQLALISVISYRLGKPK